MPDPFPRSNKRQANSRRLNLNTPSGRALRDLAAMSTTGRPDVNRVKSKISELMRIARDKKNREAFYKLRGLMNSLTGTVAARTVQLALDSALRLAGPAGRALKLVAGNTPEPTLMKSLKKDLADAEAIFAAMQADETAKQAQKLAPVTKPEERQQRGPSGPPMPKNTYVLPSGKILIKTSSGFSRTYKRTDAILTRKMVPVQSSNVHSIGFIMNFEQPAQSTLMVRFLGKSGKRRVGPGNLYQYFVCHPDEFISMRESSSKGSWVWDHLRVRGSLTGHQKRYSLKSVIGTDLPRRAGIRNGREAYIPRTRQTRAKFGEQPRTLRSSKPLRLFGKARPNSGRPNRGR